MSDLTQLPTDGCVEFGMVVAVKVRPDRGVGIEVLLAPRIAEDRALAGNDHDGLPFHPVPHLGEWMPNVRMIEASEFMHRD